MKKKYLEPTEDWVEFSTDGDIIILQKEGKSVTWEQVIRTCEAFEHRKFDYVVLKRLPHNWYAYRISDKQCIVPGNSSKNHCIKQIKKFKDEYMRNQ